MKKLAHGIKAIAAAAILSVLALPATAANVLKIPLKGLAVTATAPGDGGTGGSNPGGGGPGENPPTPVNQLTLGSTSLSFGTLTSPGAVAQDSVTVTNTGTTVVTVGAPTISVGAAHYLVTGNTCAAALNPNGACQVHVRFSPSANGLHEGTLSIPSSAVNSPLSVALSGTLTPAMTLSSVSPSVLELAGGSPVVVLTGTHFDTDATVLFGAAPATCSVQSPTEIRCTPPAQASAGLLPVTVTDASDGRTLVSADAVRYVALSASSVTPAVFSTLGGQAFAVTGTGFMPGATVTVGTQQATTCTVASNTSMSCVSPTGTNGVVSLTVTNPSGSSVTLADAITYFTPVEYAALDPTRMGSNLTLSPNQLSVSNVTATGAWKSVLGTTPKTTGKYYFEVQSTASLSGMGIASTSLTGGSLEAHAGTTANGIVYLPYAGGAYRNNGRVQVLTTQQANALIGVAVDLTAKTIQFYAKPAGGTCAAVGGTTSISAITGPVVPALSLHGTAANPSLTANFGQSPFTCSVPVGFTAGWH